VQYPGLQGGGALGDASTPGARAGSIAASAFGGTYSHVAGAGGAWGGETGAAAAAAAAAAYRRRAMPKGGAVTPPRSTPAHGGRGGRQGARMGGWDRPPATGRLQPRHPMASELAEVPPQQKPARRHDHPRVIVGASNPGSLCARFPGATRVGGWEQGGRGRPGPVTPVAGQSFSAT